MLRHLFIVVVLLANASILNAQTTSVTRMRAVASKNSIDEKTIIYDQESGRRIPYREFEQMFRPGSLYHAIPEIDEFGKVAYYVVRKKTKEELEVGHANPRNDFKQPELGQPLASFVMEGADGKTYRLQEMVGSYVLLSFWFSLEKPYFSENTTKDLVALQKKLSKKTKLISLGTTASSKEECQQAMDEFTLGFVPIPESQEFAKKYGILRMPSYILIGPDGKVIDVVERTSFARLEEHLVE